MPTLNEVFTRPSMRRRYEVWFLRFMLNDGSGAWWLRYLLMNVGRDGCAGNERGAPVQLWATWFPRDGQPQSFIQGFSRQVLELSGRGVNPFSFQVGDNQIGQDSCRGKLNVDGHQVYWDLHYRSTFRVTISNKGWIGFSRTPHSDAIFSGQISLDGKTWQGDPLVTGLQGHNCGFRHRNFWTWTHAYFLSHDGRASTFEALTYEMPFGLVFRKAVLWHGGHAYEFRNLQQNLRDRENLRWQFRARNQQGIEADVTLDGGGPSLHHLPYLRTNCSSCFEVANNSLARAVINLRFPETPAEKLTTESNAVVEMAGDR